MRILFVAAILLIVLVKCGRGTESREALPIVTTESERPDGVVPAQPQTASGPLTCVEGESKRSEDGCNTCSCTSGGWSCTELACLEPKTIDVQCVDNLPAALQERITSAYADNVAARAAAVASERARLGVEPLLPAMLLAAASPSETRYRPMVDPFPDSVVAVGEPDDIRTNGYELNHGKMGMTRVYETAPGSKRYFIVDRIGGDGIGSNGREVVAESVEYAAALSLTDGTPFAGYSWHGWHVSSQNRLVRAVQLPEDDVQETVRLCGCGPNGYEDDPRGAVRGSSDLRSYRLGIYILPGDALPVVEPMETFKALFPRKYYQKIYVPSPGKVCRELEVVC